MNLKQGYQIADSIRKYMSSPYIIPIVAFNIRQMRVVTKYNKYKEFGLTIDNELELEELSFLRSLPNDYLSKVFPPNRRIYLKSVYEILKDSWKEANIIFTLNKDDESIKLNTIDMVSLISELFYETYYHENSFENIYISTFLTNRSMRNFLNDCYCIALSLSKEKKEIDNIKSFKINWKILKDRLAPDDIYAFVTKEHALTWLWNEYIQIAKKNLTNKNSHILKNYNWAKMVTETLPEDNSAEIINKKTYARIWLQKYYRVNNLERVIQKVSTEDRSNKKEYSYEKTCDIVGALELAMRSYIPMYLFETIVRNRNLSYTNSDLVYLKSFASRSLQGIAYELSMMEATLYKGTKKFDPKPIGSVIVYESYRTQKNDKQSSDYQINDKELNIPFLFKVENKDKIGNKSREQIYILSIFKALAFFIELAKIYKKKSENEELEIKYLIEKFRVNMPTAIKDKAITMKDDYFNHCINKNPCSPLNEINDILNIEFSKSSFGVLEIASFSKRLVDFFMNVQDNIHSKNSISFSMAKETAPFNFHLPLITYFTSFSQSLFISLFHSIQHDNILSIKAKDKDKKDEIIFKKNSLYGTNKNEEKTDHLYQENINNLKRIIKGNNSEDEKIAQMQEDFNELFNYINNIPFFKFLINEANFLTDLKK